METNYKLNDIVVMKKPHPCKDKGNEWQIVRVGADVKIKCLACGNIIMLTKFNFEKKLKLIKSTKDS